MLFFKGFGLLGAYPVGGLACVEAWSVGGLACGRLGPWEAGWTVGGLA